MLIFRQILGEFAGEGGLTRALQTREHDDRRWLLCEFEPALFATENRDQLVVDDLHDLLSGVQRFADIVTEGALANAAGEVFDHLERHVSVEQSASNLANRAVHVGGRELALAAKVLERLG
ncbi:unannotated protein [freshwater metagenome]|uniref:Unannotated protein n=1 Tax=freshwater metagenome TaxID=449393 RepID=A0A6J6E748_9ZZZZ